MIFADRFVFVHLPKTGGTTVTTALYKVHLRGAPLAGLQKMINLPLKKHVYRGGAYGVFVYSKNKHGTCREIPASERGKPILGSTRSPYARYVSQYTFGWWKRREFLRYYRAVPDFETRFPAFPDLSFGDYLTLSNEAFGSTSGPGLLTKQFVEFYGRTPEATLGHLDEDPDAELDLFDVDYLRTEHLNVDLHRYLLDHGYQAEDVDFILDMGRVLPGGKGRPQGESWRKYVTPEAQAIIREREAPLFALFPEYDV
jgi:hypothetical protein